MEGKRFGVGLVVGLLLAVGVVVASGGLGSLSSAGSQALYPAASESATITVASTSSATSGTGTPHGSTTPNSSASLNSMNETYSVTSATTAPLTINSVPSSIGYMPSSRLAAVGAQSPTVNALLAVPVVLALLLGLVLYRTAAKNRTAPKDEEHLTGAT